MNVSIIIISVTFLPIFILVTFIPYWTRKTESFGVTIPEGFFDSKELIQMRKKYVLYTSFFNLATIILFTIVYINVLDNEKIFGLFLSFLLLFYLIATFFIYLYFHREMKVIKASANWKHNKSELLVIDTAFHQVKSTYSNGWFVISFAISIVVIIITFQFYELIPNQIPMQYNFSGEVTNLVEKSYGTVLTMPIMQLFLTILFLFVNTLISKVKQQISATNPEQSIKRNIVFRKRWSAFIIISSVALTIMFTLIQLSFIFPINNEVLFITSIFIVLATIVGAIVLSITTGQGGSRVKFTININDEVIDRDDDKYWKLGQFYFNKNDPAIFLEKRFGIGWTCNWARPASWLFLIGVILLSVGIPLLLMNL